MSSPVIDLSHHNEKPDFARMKAAGVVGVIMKATEGTTYRDKTFAERKAAAQAAGLIVCSYHFLKHGNITEQMRFYQSVANFAEGERAVIDFEDPAATLSDLTSAVQALRNLDGSLQVTVYSGHTIKEMLGDSRNDYLAENTSLWIAQYTNAASPSWPRGTWPQWSLWQWTDKENVPGCPKPVDGNRWNGSPEALVAWLSPAGSVVDTGPAPGPSPITDAIFVDIVAPAGIEVVVTINGAKP